MYASHATTFTPPKMGRRVEARALLILVPEMTIRPRRRQPSRAALAFVLAIAACVASSSVARADEGIALRIDWALLGPLLQQGALTFQPRETQPAPQERYAGGNPDTSPWLGTSLRVSLVARDWGSSQVLWGHLSLSDQLRLTRSTRMAVSRVRFANGRIVPFGQLGVGEWRVDQTLIPTLPGDAHPAAQLGGGVEIEIAPRAKVALESDCTMLYRESREPETLAVAHVVSALLAARATF
jgi:hypothetical protein